MWKVREAGTTRTGLSVTAGPIRPTRWESGGWWLQPDSCWMTLNLIPERGSEVRGYLNTKCAQVWRDFISHCRRGCVRGGALRRGNRARDRDSRTLFDHLREGRGPARFVGTSWGHGVIGRAMPRATSLGVRATLLSDQSEKRNERGWKKRQKSISECLLTVTVRRLPYIRGLYKPISPPKTPFDQN